MKAPEPREAPDRILEAASRVARRVAPLSLAASLLATPLLAGCGIPAGGPTLPAGVPAGIAGAASCGLDDAEAEATPGAIGLFSLLDVDRNRLLGPAEFRELGIFGSSGDALGRDGKPLGERQQQAFRALDRDRDGALTALEFDAFGRSAVRAFKVARSVDLVRAINTDGDGYLTSGEYGQLGLFGCNTSGGGGRAVAFEELRQSTFRSLDRNGDGILRGAELAWDAPGPSATR